MTTTKPATMKRDSFIVYSYQYDDMPRPKIRAYRRFYGDRRDLDWMPPTVIRWANIGAISYRNAMQTARSLFANVQP